MLTKSQLALIEALPTEGSSTYKSNGNSHAFSTAEMLRLAELPLTGKKTAPEKTAIITHGAPGSGKTQSSFEKLTAILGKDPRRHSTMAVISYDEHGALFDIPAYKLQLAATEPAPNGWRGYTPDAGFAGRLQAYEDFRALSQRIRTQTFKEALRRELPVYLDITAASPGALKMVDMLRDLDYSDIQVWSYHAPLETAVNRVYTRERPSTLRDTLEKRVGAIEMLPKLAAYADRFEFYDNGSSHLEPARIMTFDAGQMSSGDPAAFHAIISGMKSEKRLFRTLAVRELGRLEGENLTMRYDAACLLAGKMMPQLPVTTDPVIRAGREPSL